MKDIFKTRDMGCASTLIVLGYEYLGLEWLGSYGLFTFKDPGDCESKANLFSYGDLPVNARLLCQALHTLKREVTVCLQRKSNGQ